MITEPILQDALDLLNKFARTNDNEEPDKEVPVLYMVATDAPFRDNNPDVHDHDYKYLVWLTKSGLEKLQADARGRLSYWRAGWYPSAEKLIADAGSGHGEDSIWDTYPD